MIVAAPQQMLKGLQPIFIEALQPPKINYVELIATHVFSQSDKENYAWLGEVAQFVKAAGELQFDSVSDGSDTYASGFEAINEKYWGGLQIFRDDLNDNKTGGLQQRVRDLATRGMHHSTKQIIDMHINGDVDDLVANAGGRCYDGTPLFYASHPARGKQTAVQSNLVSQTGTTTATAAADIGSAIAKLYTLLDEANEPANLDFGEIYILYPAAMHKSISEAVRAGIISNTSNVQFGSENIHLYREPRLDADDTGDFYVGIVDTAVRAIIYQDREPVTFEANETGDTAFTKEVYSYKGRKRSVALPGRWQRAVKVA